MDIILSMRNQFPQVIHFLSQEPLLQLVGLSSRNHQATQINTKTTFT